MSNSNILKSLSVLLMAVLVGCSQDQQSIPKLVSIESFESQAKEEFIGSAINYTTPKLDILFVIDESGSMSKYQKSLATNIDLFLEGIGRVPRLSYRIAVVTSGAAGTGSFRHPNGSVTPNAPPLGYFYKKDPSEPDYVSNDTPNGLFLLRERLMPGDKGHATESFFEPALKALTLPEQKDFVRKDAHLAIFFLTDAEDLATFIDPPTLYEQILSIKGENEEKLTAYGALVPTGYSTLPSGCTRDDQGAPVNIESFINMTGGKVLDICGNDYGLELARVGQELGEAVGTGTTLSEVPALGTIRVYAGTRLLPNDPYVGWIYMPETNEIVFGKGLVVSEDEDIRVTYTRANQFHQ